jgi:hypothetical protein
MVRHFKYTDSSGDVYLAMHKVDFAAFDQSVLGLGEINAHDNERFQALVAIFDLEGFTAFSDRGTSNLVVPEFLEMFSKWLYGAVKVQFLRGDTEEIVPPGRANPRPSAEGSEGWMPALR